MAGGVECPQCGAAIALVNPGIVMMTCGHCRKVVVRDKGGALSAGHESMLPASDARLFQGATGTVQGKRYEVVGHLRHGSGDARWDEWYLSLADGSEAWFSEDERQLRLQTPAELPPGVAPSELHAGAELVVDGRAFSVRERGEATLVGHEGQLPYRVVPGHSYPFVELASADGTRFMTLEGDDDGEYHVYAGSPVGHDELTVEGDDPRARLAESGRDITCTNCAAALETPQPDAQTLVCAYCGAALDLTDSQRTVLGVNPDTTGPAFAFEIGQTASLRGTRYEVCGCSQYAELDDDGSYYFTLEYVLYNPDAGYLWVSQYQDHFVLLEQTDKAPSELGRLWRARPKKKFKFDGAAYRKYEHGTVTLRYVYGALPYKARVGDSFKYVELVRPPKVVVVDRDGEEFDVFVGEYLHVDAVKAAFGVDSLSKPRGVHGAEPFVRSNMMRWLMIVGAVAGLVNLSQACKPSDGRRLLFREDLLPEDYLSEYVSEPFTVPSANIVALTMQSYVNDSWVALDLALVDDTSENVVGELGGELSYYSGVDGGEGWSEGSDHEAWFFQAPPPGIYRLIARGTAGRSESPSPDAARMLELQLTVEPRVTRYFWYMAGFCLLFPVAGWLHRRSFENSRWSEVEDD